MDLHRLVGTEARKTIDAKYRDGFIERYLSGDHILDIGYLGYGEEAAPIVPQAIGIDFNYPGYDGKTLPFPDNSQDAVFSSHCLEHIQDYRGALREWHRVLRIGGYMVVAVPHQFLYEKKATLPSRWNQDHKRFYTPASLMAEVESALEPNTYRLRHLIDNDLGFTYQLPPERHSGGCYEIEMVLEKIARPSWHISDLAQTDLAPDSAVIEWSGFAAPEGQLRWSRDHSASLRFELTTAQLGAIRVPGGRLLIAVETMGSHRVRALLNDRVVHDCKADGTDVTLHVPASRLRRGPNCVRIEIPGGVSAPMQEGAQRGCFAVRGIKVLHRPWNDRHPHLVTRILGRLPRLIRPRLGR